MYCNKHPNPEFYKIDKLITGTWIIDAYMKAKGAQIARLDREKPKRRALVKHKSNEPVTPIHDRYRNVFRQLGFETPDDFTHLYAGREWPVSPIVLKKEPGQRWIAISPFSSHPNKAYPLEQMEHCLGNAMDREAWQATVQAMAELDTSEQLSVHTHQLL